MPFAILTQKWLILELFSKDQFWSILLKYYTPVCCTLRTLQRTESIKTLWDLTFQSRRSQSIDPHTFVHHIQGTPDVLRVWNSYPNSKYDMMLNAGLWTIPSGMVLYWLISELSLFWQITQLHELNDIWDTTRGLSSVMLQLRLVH